MTGHPDRTHGPIECSLPEIRLVHTQDRSHFLLAPSPAGNRRHFARVFAFMSTRSFHATCSAPVRTSSLAAAKRICVCPIFPQPPGIGRKMSGASSTNTAYCSGVSIRFPHPSACEASEANFLPPTRRASDPEWEYSSTPSRLRAILRKCAAVMARLPELRAYLILVCAAPRRRICHIGVPSA
jgi:hypothetical protein